MDGLQANNFKVATSTRRKCQVITTGFYPCNNFILARDKNFSSPKIIRFFLTITKNLSQ